MQHANLVKSAGEADTYLVNDLADPLQRSLHSLDLLDVPTPAPRPAAAPPVPRSPPPTSASCKSTCGLSAERCRALPQPFPPALVAPAACC